LGTGLASQLALAQLFEPLACKPLAQFEPAHVELLGCLLIPVYLGVMAFLPAGIVPGLLCGLICGMRPPYYVLFACAFVMLFPGAIVDPLHASLYVTGLIVSLGLFIGSVVGASIRLKVHPTPLLQVAHAKAYSPLDVLWTDLILLAGVSFLMLGAFALIAGHPAWTGFTMLLLFVAWLLFARSCMTCRPAATAASDRPAPSRDKLPS